MREVPRSEVDEYADALEFVSDAMKARLGEALAGVDFSRPVASVRDQLVPIVQAHCRASAMMASEVAAEFYERVRRAAVPGAFRARVFPSTYSDKATEEFVRASVQHVADDGERGAEAVVSESLQRLGYQVKKSAGDTVMANGDRDRATVRYARVPRPTESYEDGCLFCQMLASRGFVYHSAGTAGALSHYHDGCQCMIVPGFGANPRVEGYDPERYKAGSAEWQSRDHTQAKENRERRERERKASAKRPAKGRRRRGRG